LKARLLWDKEPVLVLKSFSGTESFWKWFFMHWFFMHWFFERLSFFENDFFFTFFTGVQCHFSFKPHLASPLLDLIFVHYSGELASFYQNVHSTIILKILDLIFGAWRYLIFLNILKFRNEHR
jgi:hypothetical protein